MKYRESSFAHKSSILCSIVLKFWIKHDDDYIVGLYAQFQKDWTSGMEIVEQRGLARFEFKMSFGQISYIVTALNIAAGSGLI